MDATLCSASHLIILFHEMPLITFCDEACKASGRFCSWEAQPDLLAQRGAHSPCLAHGLMVFDAVWMQEADPKAKRNRLVLSIFHHFFALWSIADSWRSCCDLPVFFKEIILNHHRARYWINHPRWFPTAATQAARASCTGARLWLLMIYDLWTFSHDDLYYIARCAI